MKYVIDAYSWIDYFSGNLSGQKVREYIENLENEIITNILNLAEIASFCARNNFDTEETFKVLHSNSKIFSFNEEFSKEAGRLHAEIRKKIKNFGLIDAFVLLTARKLNAKILTGDEHFRGFKEAIIIK
jgi:predicted nucleic acid-binding protein